MQVTASDPSPTGLQCLGCGYDLRATIRNGEGTVVCPECGRENDPWALRRQGLSRNSAARLIAIILAPALLLLTSAWSFAALTGQSLHAWLCILMAPAVIIAHCYGVWSYVNARFILRRGQRRRLEWAAVALAVIVDVAVCAAVVRALI